eukprot:PhM_4_TR298/c0_g1_i1/m.27852
MMSGDHASDIPINNTNTALECRMCRGGSTPQDVLRRPCGCRGSMSYVHSKCALSWVSRSGTLVCEVCRHRMRFFVTLRDDKDSTGLRMVSLLDLLPHVFWSRLYPVVAYASPMLFHVAFLPVVNSDAATASVEHLVLRPVFLVAACVFSHRCWREWRHYLKTRQSVPERKEGEEEGSAGNEMAEGSDAGDVPSDASGSVVDFLVTWRDEKIVMAALQERALEDGHAVGADTHQDDENDVDPAVGDNDDPPGTEEQAHSSNNGNKPADYGILIVLSFLWVQVEVMISNIPMPLIAIMAAALLFASHKLARLNLSRPSSTTFHLWSFTSLIIDFAFVVGILPVFFGIVMMAVMFPSVTWSDETTDALHGRDPATVWVLERIWTYAFDASFTFSVVAGYWLCGLTLTMLCTMSEFGILANLMAPGANLFVLCVREERSVDSDLWGSLWRDFIGIPTRRCVSNGLRSLFEDMIILGVLAHVPLTVLHIVMPTAFPWALLPGDGKIVATIILCFLAIICARGIVALPWDLHLCYSLFPWVHTAAQAVGLTSYLMQHDRAESLSLWRTEWRRYLNDSSPDATTPGLALPPGELTGNARSSRSPDYKPRPRPDGMSYPSFVARRGAFLLWCVVMYVGAIVIIAAVGVISARAVGLVLPVFRAKHVSVLHAFVAITPYAVLLFPPASVSDARYAIINTATTLPQLLLGILVFIAWVVAMGAKHLVASGLGVHLINEARRQEYYRRHMVACRVADRCEVPSSFVPRPSPDCRRASMGAQLRPQDEDADTPHVSPPDTPRGDLDSQTYD